MCFIDTFANNNKKLLLAGLDQYFVIILNDERRCKYDLDSAAYDNLI